MSSKPTDPPPTILASTEPIGPATAAIVKTLAIAGAGAEIVDIDTTNLGQQGYPDGVPALFDRNTQKLSSVKPLLEEYRVRPELRTGTAKVDTLQSFIDLTNRHKDPGSAIFATAAWPSPKLTAVIDYHDEVNDPRFGRHRVLYAFPVTEELKAWIALNDKKMTQGDFAAFLEEHAAELSAAFDYEKNEFEPLFKERFATPNELIQLSRELEVFVGAKVKRAERLQTGERTIEFTSEHRDAAGGKIDIPGIFMVSVRAFVDGEPVRIPARLRYRPSGGEIVWFYQLYRWEYFLKERVQEDLKTAAEATGLPAFEGAPEMAAA